MNHTPENSKKDFTPPRHWIGPEELEASYWNDPAVIEKRGQEFHDKPIETLATIEKLDTQGFARREFLTIMGASMAMATMACARRPVNKIIPHVVRPEQIIPGVATYYASTCADTGCGYLVKTREGRPIKLEGNPDHPINAGKLSVRQQAALLDLYDTARLQAPFERNRSIGSKTDLTIAEFDKKVGAALKAVAAKGGKVAVLSGATTSETTRTLVKEFLGAFSGSTYVEYEPLANDEVVAGQEESYGSAVIPSYRFDLADVVVSVGADFLGTWISAVEYSAAWAKRRKLPKNNQAHAVMSKVYSFEPNFSITGASADARYNIRPGDELKVLLAIANELIVVQGKTRFASDSAVKAALSSYSAKAVAAEIGFKPEVIQKLASELFEARGKSLIVAGGIQSKTQDAVAVQVVANLLNSALENEGKTVDGTSAPMLPKSSSFAQVEKLVKDLNSGVYAALILVKTNPAFTLPKSLGFEEAVKKVGLVIASSDRDDETAKFADFVMPETHFLEAWNDSHPKKGLYAIQQPAIQPIHQSRAFQDSLIVWSKEAGLAVKGALAKATTWHDYIMNHWRENQFKMARFAGTFDMFWENCLREGVFKEPTGASSARSFKTAALSKVRSNAASDKAIRLSVYEKISMGDGSSANNAWLQEMPDAINTSTWDNTANLSPALAKEYNLSQDDVLEISFADGQKIELPVFIQPGLHPQVVSAAIGYGRKSVGDVGNKVGTDLYPFVTVQNGVTAFSGQPIKIRKTGKVYRIAATQWHHTSENRPVINDITLAEFKKNPSSTNHTDPHLKVEELTMWPKHDYSKGYRWGMSIDLTSCTGCGACAVACQAENNIPTVGRDNVRVSRQMHWIRIDRYYSGSPENPEMIFQPMLCQHCENAPCETVCPVIATMHSSEGTNDMIYNRCVGTRYCQNNCPYKVRRFNFFDHWKQYERTLNMVWNPDVTVRTRGIMEKCSFCIQRIRGAKDAAKDRGDTVKDSDLKTACQQTCPTDAIVFGNVNDPKSKISEDRADPRTFRVLEVLNTKPAVSYLSKVRNKEAEGHSGHHG